MMLGGIVAFDSKYGGFKTIETYSLSPFPATFNVLQASLSFPVTGPDPIGCEI